MTEKALSKESLYGSDGTVLWKIKVTTSGELVTR